MPELPEVETVKAGMTPAMLNATIVKVDQNRPNLRYPFPDDLVSRLEGQRVTQLRRRSKYILIDLSQGDVLLLHLGMSGRVRISGDVQSAFYSQHVQSQKHDHLVIRMDNGSHITFNDPRRFGFVDLFEQAEEATHRHLKKLGPEPLGNSFNDTYLIEALANKRAPIKSALLDQGIVSGLGNIYVCEALWRAKISPKKEAAKLSPQKIKPLVPIIREVLQEAIAAGGSSLRDHRQTNGEMGYFQHNFSVYDQEGQPCPRDACKGKIKRIVQSGRSSFYCSYCQR